MTGRLNGSEPARETHETDRSLGNREPRGENKSPAYLRKIPGLAEWLRKKFHQVAGELTRNAPEPQPQERQRSGEARSGFRPAAGKILRRTRRLPEAAYAATSFLSHTLDWLNQWHGYNAFQDDMGDDFQPMQHDDIYPHL